MRTGLAMGAAAALAVLAGCSAGADTSAAEAGVAEFRQMLAAGRLADIYRTSAPEMQGATSEAQLTQLLSAVRDRLGEFQSADRAGWHWNNNNGVTLVTLNYNSRYAAGEAEERFVYRVGGGSAALAGYNISSMALITNVAPQPVQQIHATPTPAPDKQP